MAILFILLLSFVQGLAGHSASDVMSSSTMRHVPTSSKIQSTMTVTSHTLQTAMYQSSSVMPPHPTTSPPPGIKINKLNLIYCVIKYVYYTLLTIFATYYSDLQMNVEHKCWGAWHNYCGQNDC